MASLLTRTGVITLALLATGLLANGVVHAQAPQEIEVQQAIKVALERVPGTVTEVESDRHLGRAVFEVEILSAQGPEYEVTVDAASGEVLEAKLDD